MDVVRSRFRFRASLVGAVLGDCIGSKYEGTARVRMQNLIADVRALHERDTRDLRYTDDTAMTRSVAGSLIVHEKFVAEDMALRFAKEFQKDPCRGYSPGISNLFEKLLQRNLTGGEVFRPAEEQFQGKGSYGNGAAMRVAPVALAYPDIDCIKEVARQIARLTHAHVLGYNGAILQALAVHFALHDENVDKMSFVNKLIAEMEPIEASANASFNSADKPYCKKLEKMKEYLNKKNLSKEDVVKQFGHGVRALDSVPTAIFSFLHCLEPESEILAGFSGLARTIVYSVWLGGDTDTIASMAGAIAGAYYGVESSPTQWMQYCEGVKEAEQNADGLLALYCRRVQEREADASPSN
uniref:ADP-ribosylhydrolase ARH3 n=1 Tax=Eptatretus burgeri TaxID=7764 RepID=A0A8C4QQM5_EPTBU